MRLFNYFIFTLLSSYFCYGQNSAYIEGTVKDAYGSISKVNVILKNTNNGSQTNNNGEFKIKAPIGQYTIVVSFLGYKTITQNITLTTDGLKLNFTLESKAYKLSDVLLETKTKAQILREDSYSVEVIESKHFKNLSTNGNDILARVPGVNIRQSGGLGSNFSISLNGLTDNQIRIFIDGIPMDYFGTSLSLNNFSANLIEQIEVYKGVVPIHLSADALGGAINVTTNRSNKSFLDASYSLSSFNTHMASVNGQYRDDKTGFTTKFKSFYNYSDNNYTVDINLINRETGVFDDFTTEVEHFHDGYNSKMFWFETGFTKTKFADQLFLGILYSNNFKDIQQSENSIGESAFPYGEVNFKEDKIISNLSYAKKGLFTEKLALNSYLVNIIAKEIYTDTSDYKYDWLGNKKIIDASTGEADTRKSSLTLNKENLLANVNAEYELTENHNIALNYSLNNLKVFGNDPFNGENNTRFSTPAKLNKQVFAISNTNSLFNNKFKNSVFAKYYKFKNKSIETNFFGDEKIEIAQDKTYFGFGAATSYKLGNFQIKASYENALRFPETIELLGDQAARVEANVLLQPETTNNYNLGVLFNSSINSHGISVSANGFIRDSENFIRYVPKGAIGKYQNQESVLAKGIDLSTAYRSPKNKILVNLAATYIDKTDNRKNSTKDRIPNEPYLFGNLSISYNKNALFNKKDNFSITANEKYVHEFFYRAASLGSQDNKNIIPTQLTTDLELVYSFNDQKYNISFGVFNVFNKKVYDNLFQQRPRRTINFKLRYFIN